MIHAFICCTFTLSFMQVPPDDVIKSTIEDIIMIAEEDSLPEVSEKSHSRFG